MRKRPSPRKISKILLVNPPISIFPDYDDLRIAQSFGLELSFGAQFLFLFMTLLTSIGIASIPSGSLVIILILLRVLGLPAEGIGLFLAVDRILDMFRSATNIFADGCCAVFVARSEGEKNILTKKEFDPI